MAVMKFRFMMWDQGGNIIITGDTKEEFLRYYKLFDYMQFWIDIEGYEEDDLRWLARFFNLHPLSLEDCLRRNQRPKIEFYDGYAFSTLNIAYEEPKGEVEFKDIYLYLSKHFLISLHPSKLDIIDEMFADRDFKVELTEHGPDYIYYTFFEATFDSYSPLVETLELALDELEDGLYFALEGARVGQSFLRKIFSLRSNLITLEKFSNIYLSDFSELIEKLGDLLSEEIRVYFNDIVDNAYRYRRKLEYIKESSNDILQIYASSVNLVLQDVMKYLAIITAIFAPITFITGFFGMNFHSIPFDNPYWCWGSIISMVLSVIIFILWMKEKKWL